MKTLGLRVGTIGQRLTSSSLVPAESHRTRGRKLQQRRARYMAQNPLCPDCEAEGRVEAWTELDHVTALVNGGRDDGPVQGLCKRHHALKTARDLALRAGKL